MLKDCVFVLAGQSSKTHAEITKIIESRGGIVISKPRKAVTHCLVATPEGRRYEECKQFGAMIVTEEWLDQEPVEEPEVEEPEVEEPTMFRVVDGSPEHAIISRYCETERIYRVDHAMTAYPTLRRRLLWHAGDIEVVERPAGKAVHLYDTFERAKSRKMLLVEAAVGNEFDVDEGRPSIMRPPPGYHSVVVRGTKTSDEIVLALNGREVLLTSTDSHFLIFDPDQLHIRYILELPK